uniref:Uncharacterized protein n=1 Tax=Anguilla anguilla TaxID=7936 RepID=A0A0E9RD14_ANGAN
MHHFYSMQLISRDFLVTVIVCGIIYSKKNLSVYTFMKC